MSQATLTPVELECIDAQIVSLCEQVKTAREILFELETHAIQWGKKHQIAKVGDIVTSYLGGKRPKKFKISKVSVTLGRNARHTAEKTLVIQYVGRRINSKGELIDDVGTGRYLDEFTTENGIIFTSSENEVSETLNDCGLTFYVDFEKEAKELYPNAYKSYGDACPYYSR